MYCLIKTIRFLIKFLHNGISTTNNIIFLEQLQLKPIKKCVMFFYIIILPLSFNTIVTEAKQRPYCIQAQKA